MGSMDRMETLARPTKGIEQSWLLLLFSILSILPSCQLSFPVNCLSLSKLSFPVVAVGASLGMSPRYRPILFGL